MRSHSWLAPLWLVTAAASACTDGAEDGIDDSFTSADGKSDSSRLTEAQAFGVLDVASHSTEAQLRDDVGLGARTAKEIARYVAGHDGRIGTADDQVFDGMEELDAVPFVGSSALAALLDHAAANGKVPAHMLGRHDVSVLFPLSSAAKLWPASTSASGGALLPKEVFDKIGQSVFQNVEDAKEYDALRAVAVRVDPCFKTSLTAACQPQIRIVFQTFDTHGATNDGAIHALYNLSAGELATVIDGLRAIAPIQNRLDRPLGISPALAAQGLDGAYAKGLRALVVAHAGASNLARMTFMVRTNSRESEWRFGGFHVKANAATGFPAPGKIKIVGSTETLQNVTNMGLGGFNYGVTPEFADAAGRDGTSSLGFAQLSVTARTILHDWAVRQQQGISTVPDTTDCASCHIAGHVTRSLEARFSPLVTFDRGPRAVTGAETLSDNLRAFGYFGRDAAISVRTANETAAVVRALAAR